MANMTDNELIEYRKGMLSSMTSQQIVGMRLKRKRSYVTKEERKAIENSFVKTKFGTAFLQIFSLVCMFIMTKFFTFAVNCISSGNYEKGIMYLLQCVICFGVIAFDILNARRLNNDYNDFFIILKKRYTHLPTCLAGIEPLKTVERFNSIPFGEWLARRREAMCNLTPAQIFEIPFQEKRLYATKKEQEEIEKPLNRNLVLITLGLFLGIDIANEILDKLNLESLYTVTFLFFVIFVVPGTLGTHNFKCKKSYDELFLKIKTLGNTSMPAPQAARAEGNSDGLQDETAEQDKYAAYCYATQERFASYPEEQMVGCVSKPKNPRSTILAVTAVCLVLILLSYNMLSSFIAKKNFNSYKYGATYEDSVFTFGPMQMELPGFSLNDAENCNGCMYSADGKSQLQFSYLSHTDSYSGYYNYRATEETIDNLEDMGYIDIKCENSYLGDYPTIRSSGKISAYSGANYCYFNRYEIFPNEKPTEIIDIYIISFTEEAFYEMMAAFDSITENEEILTENSDKETLTYYKGVLA